MADSIRIKRGVKADLPKALPLGELAYCTDTRQLFIGTGNSIAPVKAEEIHFDDLNERLEGNSQNINKLYKDVNDLATNKAEKVDLIEECSNRTNDVNNLKTQLENLVLGAVGDGNNAEVIQARNSILGNNSTLKEHLDSLEKSILKYINRKYLYTWTKGCVWNGTIVTTDYNNAKRITTKDVLYADTDLTIKVTDSSLYRICGNTFTDSSTYNPNGDITWRSSVVIKAGTYFRITVAYVDEANKPDITDSTLKGILYENVIITSNALENDFYNYLNNYNDFKILLRGSIDISTSDTLYNDKTTLTVTFTPYDGGTWQQLYLECLKSDGSTFKSLNFNTDSKSYTISHNHCLVWNLISNSLDIKKFTDLQIENKSIILINNFIGKATMGYYKNVFDDLLLQRSISKSINRDEFSIPDEYKDHIKEKVAEINSFENGIGNCGDVVSFITDIHEPSNAMESASLLKYILENTSANKVFDGGDGAFGSQSITNTAEVALNELRRECIKFNKATGNRIYRCKGNHDDNAFGHLFQSQDLIWDGTVYNVMIKKQENDIVLDESNTKGMYYYIDNKIQKIRYIILNTSEKPDRSFLSPQQMYWLAEKAFKFDSPGWSVALFCHIPLNFNNINDDRAIGLISALKNKTAYTCTDNDGEYGIYNINVDYSSSDTEVMFVASGHVHKDTMTVINGVQYFTTGCDAQYTDDANIPNRAGVNKQLFDVICINKNDKKVDLVRIGAGANRTFNY